MAKLYFKYGAMGSSKTANALMTRFNYEERGQQTLLVKPRIDTRDGDHVVSSRIGLSYPCIYFDELQQIVEKYDLAQYNGQFYTVSGLPPDYGVKLEILYDSGEKIRCSNNQSCFLSIEVMEELVSLFYPNDSVNLEME